MAHDLNNDLASILALSDNFVRKTTPDHPLHQGSKTIKDSVQQAARLVQQLVAMHLSKLGEFHYHDLNQLTEETVEFCDMPRREGLNLGPTSRRQVAHLRRRPGLQALLDRDR